MGSNLKIVWLIPIKMGLKFKNRKGSRQYLWCEPFAILNLYLFLLQLRKTQDLSWINQVWIFQHRFVGFKDHGVFHCITVVGLGNFGE